MVFNVFDILLLLGIVVNLIFDFIVIEIILNVSFNKRDLLIAISLIIILSFISLISTVYEFNDELLNIASMAIWGIYFLLIKNILRGYHY